MNHISSLTAQDFMTITWTQLEPRARQLLRMELNEKNVGDWLMEWSDLSRIISEAYQRRYAATTVDTTDETALQQYQAYVDEIQPAWMEIEQKLKEKLLASGMEPPELEIPLRNMRAESDLYQEANLPLLSEELKLSNEYDQIIGAQTTQWEGEEVTLTQLQPVYQERERARRELAWRAAAERRLADRQTLNDLWRQLLDLRLKIAANTEKEDYRAYRWQQMLRFDYTPQDCLHFHRAIERVVVPAASRLYEKRRLRLGLDTLRPWDLEVDPFGAEPLHPYHHTQELVAKTEAIFDALDPALGNYFRIMKAENLLDLDNRKGKAPGAYCTNFDASRKPFIFMNGVGLHDDVMTLVHEAGHAFHVFESVNLPYHCQTQVGLEFAEVASTSMELLAAPYLSQDEQGFYTPQQAARARLAHLEQLVLFLPFMAVVDAFQHWAYTQPERASQPKHCDAIWRELCQRYMPGIDWSGLEEEYKTGWQRKLHIFQVPFYYIEYGLAQLGAIQVWANALNNPTRAIADYRRALSLGGTAPLPQLYAAAGARFAFDDAILHRAISLIEKTMTELEESLS